MSVKNEAPDTTIDGIDVEHFRLRVLQDALAEATSGYWLRRAKQLEEARARPEDYTGRATPQRLAARDEQLQAAIAACRHRATLAPLRADTEPLATAALEEVD